MIAHAVLIALQAADTGVHTIGTLSHGAVIPKHPVSIFSHPPSFEPPAVLKAAQHKKAASRLKDTA